MTDVFVSWSGGKDGCLACYRATASGLDIRCLANTITEDGKRSYSHGISAGVIRVQSEALGIPVIQRRTTGDSYEVEFVKMLKCFKNEGIQGGVFGDIDFDPHREWIEKVCRQADITPYLPLWQEIQKKLMEEFIDAGFTTIVIAAKADIFGEEVLEREIDRNFIKELEELSKTRGITPCGEAGEYHTLVIDGPMFQKRLEIKKSRKVKRGEHYFLDILSTELKAK